MAVLSIPLYFSVLTNTGFEADKAALLRLLAAVAAAGWLIGFVYRQRPKANVVKSNILLILGIAVFLVYCLATVLSIDPRLGLFGSQLRQEGLVTQAAYLIFFVSAATRLNSWQRIDRLITVMLFGSLPILAYAMAQQFGFDPIPTSGDFATLQWPVRSTFGQHIFLGSYLVLILPFTAGRLLHTWQHRSDLEAQGGNMDDALGIGIVTFALVAFFVCLNVGYHHPILFALFPAILAGFPLLALVLRNLPDSSSMRNIRLAGYAGLLVLQIETLGFTGARGPWVGAFASLPVFGILLAWRLQRPRIWKSVLAASIVAGIFVTVLNIPGGPLQPLRTVHGLTRVADITESGGTEVGSVKGRLLIWQGISNLITTHPSIGNTWGGPGRDVVGYGPESMGLAFEKVFPVKLRRATFETWWWDRAHNIFLDHLIDAGLLGLLAFLAVVVAFFWKVIRILPRASGDGAHVVIAMASAIAGYLVAGLFGLDMPATFLLFWLIVGIAAGLHSVADEAKEERAAVQSLTRLTVGYWVGLTLVAAILAALFPGAALDHPVALAVLWVVASVGGLVVIWWHRWPATGKPQVSGSRRSTSTPRPPWWRPTAIPVLVISLLASIVVLDQMRFETAAFGERDGTTAFSLGQDPTAIGSLQQAALTNPYEPLYRSELGSVFSTLAGKVSNSSAAPQLSISGNVAETIDPTVALTLSRSQLYALSANAFQSASSLAPLQPDYFASLGNTYRLWRRTPDAVAVYRQAERLGVNNPQFIDGEALAFIDGGNPQAGLQRALVASHIDSSYWFSHYALARAYHGLGQHIDAKREAATALFWVPVASPQPASTYITELHRLQRRG